jgi:hypothetical protein
MLIGDAEGWFRYLEPGDPEPHSRTLPLHIQEIGGQPMDVPSDYALHWLLGVADFYGPEHARLIAYRDGLV